MFILTAILDESITLDFDDEFTLNYEYPEKNKGFICIRVNNVRDKGFVMDSICIYKFYNDPREAQSDHFYSAELVEDGKAVVINQPALPLAFIGTQDMRAAMLHVVKNQTSVSVAEATKVEFETLAVNVIKDVGRRTTSTLIHLPSDLDGCNEYLNGDLVKFQGSGNSLKNLGSFLPYKLEIKKGLVENYVMPFVYWVIPIKSSIRITDSEVVGRPKNNFEEALKSMPITNELL